MKTTTIAPSISMTAGIALALGSAHAGTIAVAELTNNETQIVNTGGPLVSAVNFGRLSDSGTTDVDINGIVHTVSNTSNTSGLDRVSSQVSGNIAFVGLFRGGAATAAGLTGDLQNLVGSIGGANSGGVVLDFDVQGLTPDEDYLFQAYFEAGDAGALSALPTVQITFEGTDTTTFSNQANTAFLISYSFTAGDSMLDVQFNEAPAGSNIWLSGYSLQQVPETSTALLGALGSLILLRRRRN